MRTLQDTSSRLARNCAGTFARWRTWLVLFTLVWLVALYSTQATHFVRTFKDTQQCPKCQVERPFALNVLEPELKIALTSRISFYFRLQNVTYRFIPLPTHFKPPTRAPPSQTS